ncbi:MAG: Hsp70 family protein [Rickettsiales bacterium]
MQKIQIQSSNSNQEPIISIDFGTTTCLVGIYGEDKKFSIINFDAKNNNKIDQIQNNINNINQIELSQNNINNINQTELSQNDDTAQFHLNKNQYSLPTIIAFNDKNEFIIGKTTKEYNKVIHSIKRSLGHTKEELLLDELKYFFDIEQNSNIKNTYSIPLKINNNQVISNLEIIIYIFDYLKQITENYLEQKVEKIILTAPVYFNEQARSELRFCAEQAGLQVVKIIPEPVAAIYSHTLQNGTYLVFDIGGGTFDLSIIQLYEDIYRVIANDGNRYIGGDQIDIAILNSLINKYSIEILNKISNDNSINFARYIKEFIYLNNSNYKKEYNFNHQLYTVEFSLQELEQITLDFISKIMPILKQMLINANKEIDGVVFVGSTTKITAIQNAVISLLPFAKQYIHSDPSTSVALGAISHIYSLKNTLFQVSPLSLGIEIMGNVVEKIIDRNTQLPALVKRTFTNYSIEQNKVKINILEGEREIVSACKSLGVFEIPIPQANPGTVKIEIIFSLDFNAELLVTAIVNNNAKTFFKYEPFKNINLEEEIYSSIANHESDCAAKELSSLQVKAKILFDNLTKLHKIKPLEEKLFNLLNELEAGIKENNITKLNLSINNINNYYAI